MTQQKSTDEAIAECRAMTQMMKDSVARYETEQAEYMRHVAEYGRRKRNYDTTAQFFLSECAGNLEPGDVFFRGGHPACRNRKLNVPPIEPTPPILPSLGTFICQICKQDVTLAGQAGRDFNVAKDAIQQQMNCVASVEQQMREEATKGDAGETAAASQQSQSQTITEKKTVVAATESNTTMLIIILIIGILIAIAVGIAIYSYASNSAPGPTPSLT